MTREEMEVLSGLMRICAEAPAFVLVFPDSGLPVDDEIAFATRLADVAEGIFIHAKARRQQLADRKSEAGSGVLDEGSIENASGAHGLGDVTAELKKHLSGEPGRTVSSESDCPEG